MLGEALLPASPTPRPRKPPIPQWQERTLVVGGVAAVVLIPLLLLVYEPRHSSTGTLPFHSALGCMLLVGWISGRATDFLFGLPPLLGYMAFGYAFRSIEGLAMTAARPYVLKLAFILILMRAGLEIQPRDLTPFTVALGMLPFAADALAASLAAAHLFALSPLEAAAFGAIVCALGDGIVIPRMIDLCMRARGGQPALARAVLTAAPIECTTALFFYGTVAELLAARPSPGTTDGSAVAASHESSQPPWPAQAALVLARLCGTLLVSAGLAHVFALLLGARRRIQWRSGKQLFNGTQTEELVVMLAAALLAYGMAAMLPMPARFRPSAPPDGAPAEALVEADLAVVATLFFFARLRPAHTVLRVEESVGAVWTVAALFLFVSLGSNLTLPRTGLSRPSGSHAQLGGAGEGGGGALAGAGPPRVCALLIPLAAGLCARAFAALAVLMASASTRGVAPKLDANGVRGRGGGLGSAVAALRHGMREAAFYLAATLPRATLQGVLGGLPLQNAIVSTHVGELYHAAAACTVVLLAPLGVVAQELLCERLLATVAPDLHETATSPPPPPWAPPPLDARERSAHGGKTRGTAPPVGAGREAAGTRSGAGPARGWWLAETAGALNNWAHAARWLSHNDTAPLIAATAEAQAGAQAGEVTSEGATFEHAPPGAAARSSDCDAAPCAQAGADATSERGVPLEMPPGLERTLSVSLLYTDGPTLPAAGAVVSSFSAASVAGRASWPASGLNRRAQTIPRLLP